MSVYTPLSRQQMSALLADYGFQLVDFRGASHGIENSTFLIEARDPQGQPCAGADRIRDAGARRAHPTWSCSHNWPTMSTCPCRPPARP